MPRLPVISVVVALYLAGLLIGFGTSGGGAFMAIGAVLVCAMASHGRRVAIFGVFLVVGVVTARSAGREEAPCSGQALGDTLVVVLDADASPGIFVRGHGPSCDGNVSLFVAAGRAPAGSSVRVTGEVFPSSDGVVIRDASLRLVSDPPLFARLRARAGTNIDRAFGRDAPLVRALLIAAQAGVVARGEESLRGRWVSAHPRHRGSPHRDHRHRRGACLGDVGCSRAVHEAGCWPSWSSSCTSPCSAPRQRRSVPR